MRIAMSGASGMIGHALAAHFETAGHTVVPLVRRQAGPGEIAWDPYKPLAPSALGGIGAVVHLAGAPIAQRWTPEHKKRIRSSRVEGTRHLAQAVAAMKEPAPMLSMSAEGYYGDQGDALLGEESDPGDSFLAEVCQAWEAAADPLRDVGGRVVHPRLGLVMARQGGALARMLVPFKLGLGGPIGSGQQWWTWIAFTDTIRALAHVLDSSLVGPVNVAGPEPLRNRDFVKELGRALHRPARMPLPSFAVKALFGEMGEEILLTGHRLDTTRLRDSGFVWSYPELSVALQHELP
jgi:uncharacterized protein